MGEQSGALQKLWLAGQLAAGAADEASARLTDADTAFRGCFEEGANVSKEELTRLFRERADAQRLSDIASGMVALASTVGSEHPVDSVELSEASSEVQPEHSVSEIIEAMQANLGSTVLRSLYGEDDER
jgi:hypothetical protein